MRVNTESVFSQPQAPLALRYVTVLKYTPVRKRCQVQLRRESSGILSDEKQKISFKFY